MIYYMPFTYIDDQYLGKLNSVFGPVSICSPDPASVPGHMQLRAKEKLLDVRCPQGLNADHLGRAIAEFRGWADLHQGNIADMAGFFKSQKGRPPLMDETNPTRIGDQIRKFGQDVPTEPDDPQFRAALFLSMAQEHDRQLDDAAKDLGHVAAMEQDMLAGLSGESRELDAAFGSAPARKGLAGASDPGAFMTAKRIQSWSRLACSDTGLSSCHLFLTSSPAVIEHLSDVFDRMPGPWTIKLDSDANGAGNLDGKTLDDLKALSIEQTPESRVPEPEPSILSDGTALNLKVYVLSGVSPADFPCRLAGLGDTMLAPPSTDNYPLNTLIGLLER